MISKGTFQALKNSFFINVFLDIYHCRQNGMFFRQRGKLVVNFDNMTTDQKHCRMCKRRGVSHILARKRGVSFTLFKKLLENSIFSPITGEGHTPGTPYAGSATGG